MVLEVLIVSGDCGGDCGDSGEMSFGICKLRSPMCLDMQKDHIHFLKIL